MTKKQVQGKWNRLLAGLPKECNDKQRLISSTQSLYSVFDSSMLSWLGALFDRDIGGFYYSNSARDGEEFFPDIESTGQAIGILKFTGVINSYKDIPEIVRSGIACFVCSCEDPENGFFYNPQWSKDEVDKKLARRSRDSRWAVDLAEMCNFKIPHPTIFSKIKDGSGSSTPQFLKNEEEFIEYLASLDWQKDVYKNMHTLVSQYDQIIDAGLGEIALKHISSLQNKDTGLFGYGFIKEENLIKVLRTALTFFLMMKRPMPMYEEAFAYALKCAGSTKVYDISYLASSWGTISAIIKSLTEYGGEAGKRAAEELLVKNSDILAEVITNTEEYLKRFKKPDGSFSYTEHSSSSTSQSMPVAKFNSFEGDVNGTVLAVSVANAVVRLLSSNKIFLPIYVPLDFEKFLNAVK